jgi:hypothetical protein
MGSATNDTTRELGGALGVAVLGSLVTSQYASGIGDALGDVPAEVRDVAEGSLGGALALIGDGVLPGELLGVAKEAFVNGFSAACAVAAAVVALAAVGVLRLLPSDRDASQVTGEGGAPDSSLRRQLDVVTAD